MNFRYSSEISRHFLEYLKIIFLCYFWIMIEDNKFIEEKILPYLTKEICILLNENKDELKK